jgi:hypothetical protein
VRVGPDDGFVLRPRFKGIWEVLETTRKEYMVRCQTIQRTLVASHTSTTVAHLGDL